MGHGQYSGNHPRFSKRQEERYDARMAHDKDLSASARLHYLENDETHHPAKMDYPAQMGHPVEMNYALKEMDMPVKNHNQGYGYEMGKPSVGMGKPLREMDMVAKEMDMPVQNFGYVASQAKKAGDKSFEYAGKTFPVKESRELKDMSGAYNAMGDANEPNKMLDKAVREYGPVKKHGSMKGDQSATRVDYANYKGTDKGYHGHSGSSHGDQSATRADYLKGNVSHPAKEHGKPHGPAMEKAGRPAILRHCSPGHK